MAESATIARPYARAAFGHAHAEGQLAAWSEMLGRAAATVADERVARLVGSPKVTSAELVELIAGIAGGTTGQGGRNFLAALAHNRRLLLLPEIASQFERLRAEVENVVDVELVSAMPVDAAQEQRLAAALRKRLGREVRIHTQIDASLIGGAIVRAGDLVIDGSLRGRLERLGTTMSA